MKLQSRPMARRIHDIEPFRAMELLARARELEQDGLSIVHMELGEPDFSPISSVVRAGTNALQLKNLGYTPAAGLTELRQAIARDYYERKHNISIDPNRIIITSGASVALQLILAVIVDVGDEVLLTDPGYPCYPNILYIFGGRPRYVPVHRATRYQLTGELLRAHWSRQTRAALLASPANPTGTMIPESDLREMAEYARTQMGCLIVDEIYQGLIYIDQPPPTTLSIADDVFVVNSFSKYFGMTGWRLGWLVAPENYLKALEKLQQNLYIAASTPAQYAAIAALSPQSDDLFEARRIEFLERRNYLLATLTDLGFEIPVVPDGAFYLYANCEHFGMTGSELSHRLLEEAGVAVTPGEDFGHFGAEQHVRFAYTTSMDNLREGVNRMSQYFSGR